MQSSRYRTAVIGTIWKEFGSPPDELSRCGDRAMHRREGTKDAAVGAASAAL